MLILSAVIASIYLVLGIQSTAPNLTYLLHNQTMMYGCMYDSPIEALIMQRTKVRCLLGGITCSCFCYWP